MTTIESQSAVPAKERAGATAPQKQNKKGAPRPKRAARPSEPERAAEPRPALARPRAPFVLLVLCLLGGALVSLLVLNTVLARDAYTLTGLESSVRKLNEQKQALIEDNMREEAPARLAQKAQAQGMVQPNEPAFVDPGDGRVTGSNGAKVRPVPSAAAAAAAAAAVLGVPGAIVPGDGIPGWTGATAAPSAQPKPVRPKPVTASTSAPAGPAGAP